jgi:Collagen triple helix repeat (20 copies)
VFTQVQDGKQSHQCKILNILYIIFIIKMSRIVDLSVSRNSGGGYLINSGSGATGPTGPTGNTGLSGPTGLSGTTGVTGLTGPVGLIGASGVATNTGPTGAVGSSNLRASSMLYGTGSLVSIADTGTNSLLTVFDNTGYSLNFIAGTAAGSLTCSVTGAYQINFSSRVNYMKYNGANRSFWIYNNAVQMLPGLTQATVPDQLYISNIINLIPNDVITVRYVGAATADPIILWTPQLTGYRIGTF